MTFWCLPGLQFYVTKFTAIYIKEFKHKLGCLQHRVFIPLVQSHTVVKPTLLFSHLHPNGEAVDTSSLEVCKA